jgi:antitoxin MazE
MAKNTATRTLQRWGNSHAVRIPASLARSVGFREGQPVELSAQDSAVLVSAADEPRLSLTQMLALFDREIHRPQETGELYSCAPAKTIRVEDPGREAPPLASGAGRFLRASLRHAEQGNRYRKLTGLFFSQRSNARQYLAR